MNASPRWSRWTMPALVAGALLAGTVIGPAVAQAAAAGLVRLEGGGSSNVAKVSSAGQLSVNPGLAQTAAGQILAAEASPSSYVTAIITPNCASGGTYQIPPGDAFILTGAEYDLVGEPSPPEALVLYYGPSATPCTSEAAFSASEAGEATDHQVFQPGIAIPAGDAVAAYTEGSAGGIEIYGYLVPASEVPPHAATAGRGRTSFLPLPRH